MQRADLLYSGLMFAAGMLSVWTALLLTADLRCPRARAAKIRIPRCYNFIYRTSWCRRTYAP